MISMKFVLSVFVLVILTIAAFATPSTAQGQSAGSAFGSKTVVYTFGNGSPLNGTSIEAKISSNSSFVVSTVLVETNSSMLPAVTVREWRVYDSSGGAPFVYLHPAILPTGIDDEVRTLASVDMLPLGVPENGSLGIMLETLGLQPGDQIKITFVYMTIPGGIVSAEVLAPASIPFYVTERSTAINATGLEIDDSFVNPEIHCELCTRLQRTGAEEGAEATYTIDATDLTGATKFLLWAMGSDGGENMTFNVAGRDGTFANTTSVILHNDWTRYEVDLAGVDLTNITHLLGVEVNSGQELYVKGAAYY